LAKLDAEEKLLQEKAEVFHQILQIEDERLTEDGKIWTRFSKQMIFFAFSTNGCQRCDWRSEFITTRKIKTISWIM
jgi:hypothetical protein